MDNNLIITLRSISDPCAFARFTWSEDLQDCDVVAMGIDDDAMDAILSVRGHEGAPVAGYTVVAS